ncbi:hypothetical protein D932_01549 [Enterococcus casseliflavus 14-MB-W-14]|nr:hypothetical protein D932_01549 [Enterococcus casseliflavus 14-MB-W-14]
MCLLLVYLKETSGWTRYIRRISCQRFFLRLPNGPQKAMQEIEHFLEKNNFSKFSY